MKFVTFVNYDAKHRWTTERDLSTINAHVSTHVATNVNRQREGYAEAFASTTDREQSPITQPVFCRQIGGLRTDVFHVLPIKSTCYTSLALDYCECIV